MINIKKIYNLNDNELDQLLFNNNIEYFKNADEFSKLSKSANNQTKYDDLNDNVKDYFRKIFYGIEFKLNINTDDFISLITFLDYINLYPNKLRLSAQRQLMDYMNLNIHDADFYFKTARFHKNPYLLYGACTDKTKTQLELYLKYNIRDFNEIYTIYNKNFNYEHKLNEIDLFIYAQLLEYGIGCDIDIKKASHIYKLNYDCNDHPDSLFRYALIIEKGELYLPLPEKAIEYYNMLWHEYENVPSLCRLYHLKNDHIDLIDIDINLSKYVFKCKDKDLIPDIIYYDYVEKLRDAQIFSLRYTDNYYGSMKYIYKICTGLLRNAKYTAHYKSLVLCIKIMSYISLYNKFEYIYTGRHKLLYKRFGIKNIVHNEAMYLCSYYRTNSNDTDNRWKKINEHSSKLLRKSYDNENNYDSLLMLASTSKYDKESAEYYRIHWEKTGCKESENKFLELMKKIAENNADDAERDTDDDEDSEDEESDAENADNANNADNAEDSDGSELADINMNFDPIDIAGW